MEKRYCVFDLDGTLLNTLDDLTNSVNMALQKNGLPLRSKEEIRRFVGNGVRKTVERSVPEGTDLPLEEQTYRDFCRIYEKEKTHHTRPYPGILEMLGILKKNGWRLAVLSNKSDDAVKSLCDIHFPNLFEVCQGLTDDIRPKPYPDSLWTICKKMGTAPENVIYIGDSEVDVSTAEAAGTDLIAVTWGFRTKMHLLEIGASQLVDHPLELVTMLSGFMSE